MSVVRNEEKTEKVAVAEDNIVDEADGVPGVDDDATEDVPMRPVIFQDHQPAVGHNRHRAQHTWRGTVWNVKVITLVKTPPILECSMVG